jgi:hypothetical protein
MKAMPAHDSRIWVVISDGANTRICSCDDGMTMPIVSPVFEPDDADSDRRGLNACRAWFKAEQQSRPSRNPRRQHIAHVSQVLLEAAREGAYGGLIIIADESVAADLEDALSLESRALLIGKIVRDFPQAVRATLMQAPAVRH